jgi:hypothetical protein
MAHDSVLRETLVILVEASTRAIGAPTGAAGLVSSSPS